ncbi:MAG: radical SAM protein [Pseudomonadota bacterium]
MTDAELYDLAQERVRDLGRLQGLGLLPLDGDFFPSVHYPPITMYPPMEPADLLRGYENPFHDKFSIYLHIPFCENRCEFCHYPVAMHASELRKEQYLDMLAREMDNWLAALGLSRFRARSVLIAGGTPTALSPRLFARMHRDLAQRVDLGPCTQLAYDVHPRDLLGPDGRERLRIMRDYGSTRLTIGAQSFDDAILARMGRGHTTADTLAALESCHAAGYDDVCIEFIFGYPGQTFESWMRTLRLAIASGAEEIQLYRLKVVPYGDHDGDILGQRRRQQTEFIPVDRQLAMKQASILALQEAGFQETLTRVFSKDPHHFSHYASDQCCKLHDQLGFGLSTFSSLRDRFSITPDRFPDYYRMIEAGQVPINRGQVRSADENRRWHVVLPLKNWKIHHRYYALRTGVELLERFPTRIALLREHGLLEVTDKLVRLSPLGRFFADEVCTLFYSEGYVPFAPERYAGGPLNPHAVTRLG